MATYVRYSPAVEEVPADEADTLEKIVKSMHRLAERNSQAAGRPIRVSHAKSHGVAVGELEVLGGLPEPLAQGLFATAATYPVIVRLANVPGEIDADSVATQRGLSFKVMGVEGEMLPGHAGQHTQDFVLDTSNRFPAADAKAFLLTHLQLEHAPQMPDGVKAAVSAVSRATNKALHAVGLDSANMDFFGHSRVHPLAEAYYSQAPIRYGDYVAKLAVVPVAPTQTALVETEIDTKDPNGLRTATVGYLRDFDAEFDIRIQLCTDLDSMPVENANTEWKEEESPYRTVARLRVPRQDAFSDARRAYVDDALSFCVSHSLAAHRPLGSIQRARLRAYPEMSRLRRGALGRPVAEPASIREVPA